MVAVPGVVAPTTSSVVLRSSSVFTGAVCQTVVTWISRLVEPIQLKLAGSNFAVVGLQQRRRRQAVDGKPEGGAVVRADGEQ